MKVTKASILPPALWDQVEEVLSHWMPRFGLAIVLAEFAGTFTRSVELRGALSLLLTWIFFPLAIIWCALSIRKALNLGVAPLPFGQPVAKNDDPMLFLIAVGTYWTVAAIFTAFLTLSLLGFAKF